VIVAAGGGAQCPHQRSRGIEYGRIFKVMISMKALFSGLGHSLRSPGRVVITGVTVTALTAIGGVAYAYFTSDGSGSGSAGVVANVGDLDVIGPPEAIELKIGQTVNLHGSFINRHSVPVSVEKVAVTISLIRSATGGTVLDDQCNKTNDVDFHIEDAVRDGPFPVSAASASEAGFGDWKGASITLKNDPYRNQKGCRGVRVFLAYDIANL
jgi:hypothetical protein